MLGPFAISSVLNTISVPVFTYAYGEKRTPSGPTKVARVCISLFFNDWRIAFAVSSAVVSLTDGALDIALASEHEFPVISVSEHASGVDFSHHIKMILVSIISPMSSIFFMVAYNG